MKQDAEGPSVAHRGGKSVEWSQQSSEYQKDNTDTLLRLKRIRYREPIVENELTDRRSY